MRQTVLGEPLAAFEKKLNRQILRCSLAVVGLLCANVVACLLHTDANHRFLLAFNILTDIIVGSLVLYRVETHIRVNKSLLRLAKRTPRTLTATVEGIAEKTCRIPGLDCLAVHTDRRVLYLPETDGVCLEQDKSYTFQIVDNVILEVES